MGKVKICQKKVIFQGQDYKVKYYGTTWKVFSQEIHMCNRKALTNMVFELWLKFLFTHPTWMPTLGLWHKLPGQSYGVARNDDEYIIQIYLFILQNIRFVKQGCPWQQNHTCRHVNRKAVDSSNINIQRGKIHNYGHIWQKFQYGWVALLFLWQLQSLNCWKHKSGDTRSERMTPKRFMKIWGI